MSHSGKVLRTLDFVGVLELLRKVKELLRKVKKKLKLAELASQQSSLVLSQ